MRLLVACVLVAVACAVSETPRDVMYQRYIFPGQYELRAEAPGDATVRATFALKQRNLDQLEAKFWAVSTPGSSEYRNFLTNEQVMSIIAPAPETRQTVLEWLTQNGVRDVTDRIDSIVARMPVAVAEELFQTQFYVFDHKQRSTYSIIRQMGAYSLPRAVRQAIDFVTGVSDFPMVERRTTRPSNDQGVVPQTLETIYHIPSGVTAPGTSQGVIEFGAGEYFDPTDLATYSTQTTIPIDPISPDHIVGGSSSPGVEGTLDIQYIASTGVGAVNWYWTESDWLYDWANSFFAATSKPNIVSLSYAWSETNQCDIDTTECSTLGIDSQAYVARVNTEFQKIGLGGQSILCASGDSGCHGRTDYDCSAPLFKPEFPAASPYVTSVGATQLNNPVFNLPNPPPICNSGYQCPSGGDEAAVSFDVASFTSGGGFSNYSPVPSYQKSVVSAYFTSGVDLPPSTYYNSSNRGHPDIASIGHNVLIYEGGVQPVGGTSASAPSVAGYMSLLNQVVITKTGKPLGFLNPFLYKMYADHPAAYRDITVGDNICTEGGCSPSCKGFKAYKGWDPVTGLGVPNVQEMLNYVKTKF